MARIGDTALRDRFRFGLVAYRDDLGGNQALEYVTRTYARADFTQPPTAVLPRSRSIPGAIFQCGAARGLS